MDSDSSSSSCLSYEEEYWLMKKRYDEVLESNSQMVLRLEEAKSMLYKSSKELQSQNGLLMTENMNLRAQKEYFQRELEKFRTVIESLAVELECQRSSMDRQKDYLAELMSQVDSVAENKNNDLIKPESKLSSQKKSAPFLNQTALHELDKQLRASNIASYYLPAIEEENSEHHYVDHGGNHQPSHRKGDTCNITRTIRPSVSKIRKHCSSAKSKRNPSKEEISFQRENGSNSALLLSKTEVILHQRTEQAPAEIINHMPNDENTNSSSAYPERMVATVESCTSTPEEHKNIKQGGVHVVKKEKDECKGDVASRKSVSETPCSNFDLVEDINEHKEEMPVQEAIEVCGVGGSVDVVLESPEGGYFLKQATARAQPAEPPSPGPPSGAVLTTERFAVFQTSRPLAVRASYGPFSTKQTVPARSLVAEPSSNSSDISWGRHLDLSAHLVTKTVERDWPVVRVVMHTGAEPGAQKVCAVVHATMGDLRVSGACSPDTHEGMCLVELVLPWSWWPPLPSKRTKPTKTPPRLVSLAYTVVEPLRGPQCTPKVMIQSLTPLGNVQLTTASQGYNTISTDNHVTMLMPQRPLYPTSKVHIPTYITIKRPSHISGFMLRARVKSGLKVLGAELISREDWNMTVEINSKQSVATVVVISKQTIQDMVPRTEEVFVWIIEVAGGGVTDLWQEGKLVWSVRYLNEKGHPISSQNLHGKHKASVRININKDDIHALIPISKNWEVVNSAILTGKQVSQGMKVVMVSHGGHLADVTLQASCHVPDDSVIKVSSSCSSVYVDGSEVRGSANASVVVKYGNLAALASFTVWMPELPVEVSLPDTRLSQVKGWRVPDFRASKLKRSIDESSALTLDNNVEKPTACRLRYQQTDVEVYARFVAADHDSGRVSYLVNRRTWLRVTQLVLGLLRVSDTRIATLQGNILQGRAPGRTELQVVSAVSGRVLGAKEVRVLSDKVNIVKLSASVVSGLQLAISPDTGVDNGYIAQASVTRKLTAQYQEGLLDMELVFSDGSTTSVSSIEREDYQLTVETERPDVVAFAPQTPMSQPRVIAVSQGRGNLLTVTMHPPLLCGSKVPLSTTHAHVDIDFTSGLTATRPELIQNDGGANREIAADLHDILIGIPLKDEHNHEPTVQARQHHSNSGNSSPTIVASKHIVLSPLEIGMYILLAAFCFAIVVFVVSCVVYASKFKADHVGPGIPGAARPEIPSQHVMPNMRQCQTTQNAHDWVWLGRSTLHVTDNPMHHAPFYGRMDVSTHPHHHWDQMMDTSREENAPPVPPHGAALDVDDYRPPVPPHRKSPANGGPPPLPPHGKHHHHHKARGRKRATVLGNPIFTENDTGLALEELNLGMDYNQIMHYFDNLKESNA